MLDKHGYAKNSGLRALPAPALACQACTLKGVPVAQQLVFRVTGHYARCARCGEQCPEPRKMGADWIPTLVHGLAGDFSVALKENGDLAIEVNKDTVRFDRKVEESCIAMRHRIRTGIECDFRWFKVIPEPRTHVVIGAIAKLEGTPVSQQRLIPSELYKFIAPFYQEFWLTQVEDRRPQKVLRFERRYLSLKDEYTREDPMEVIRAELRIPQQDAAELGF